MSAPWMMTRVRVAEKLRPAGWNKKLPVMAEGDAGLIATAAGRECFLKVILIYPDLFGNMFHPSRLVEPREQKSGSGGSCQ